MPRIYELGLGSDSITKLEEATRMRFSEKVLVPRGVAKFDLNFFCSNKVQGCFYAILLHFNTFCIILEEFKTFLVGIKYLHQVPP